MMKRILFVLLGTLVVLVLFVRTAAADSPSFKVTAPIRLELGDIATIKVTVSGTEMPEQPLLAVKDNSKIALGNPSTFALMLQGMPFFTATWTVQGKALGDVTLVPSVMYGGKRVNGNAFTIIVVPSTGAKPTRPPGSRFGPFPFPFEIQIDDTPPKPQPKTDPELALETAPAPIAFLRATVDKKNAVVGEQVILEIDLYADAAYEEPDFNDAHEASSPQFVRHSLMKDDTKLEKIGNAMVGGRVWEVKRIRRAALFPMEAGDLTIGAMNVNMVSTRSTGVRYSDPITVHVTDPPAAGKPVNYALGDVGEYSLAAEVDPREIKRGDVVSVRVELGGTGNVPARLPLPARKGLEWMDAEVHDQIGRIDEDHWGGTKTFVFALRLVDEGDIDLGDLALPVWNTQKNAYDDLRVQLGKVHVLPGTLPPSDTSTELPSLPPARGALAGLSARKYLDDSPFFWMGLLAPAAIFASAAGARTAVRRARERLAARAVSPERELARRLRDADDACAGKDGRAADAAIVRALEQAAIVKRAVNVRGVTKSEAVRVLQDAGVSETVAKEIGVLLRECEESRFSPTEDGLEPARERWTRARKALESL